MALETLAPEFVDKVQQCPVGQNIVLELSDFEANPGLLYHCIWYAASNRRHVAIGHFGQRRPR